MQKQIKESYENVLPVLIDEKGRMDPEMEAWIKEGPGDGIRIQSIGILKYDGDGFRVYQAVGLNASTFATKYAKRFWSERKRKGCAYIIYEDGSCKIN